MSYLRNDGDVIVDFVLTDSGRARLAKGDGSFKIAKFALGDDEIDYSLFNKTHASGSAYYDLNILQLPVFEAWSNNAIEMNSRLVSIPRNDLLYLPILKLSTILGPGGGFYSTQNTYVVATNDETIAAIGVAAGIIDGQTVETAQRTPLVIEQGIDSTQISPAQQLADNLKETQYFVSIDSRFGELVTPVGQPRVSDVSFIDSDQFAYYLFSLGSTAEYVSNIKNSQGNSAIRGPRGTMLKFGIKASMELNTQTYLFTTLGSTTTIGTTSCYYLDTSIEVTGLNTGYKITIPIRFVRKV